MICCDFGGFVGALDFVIYVTRRPSVWAIWMFSSRRADAISWPSIRFVIGPPPAGDESILGFRKQIFVGGGGRKKEIDWRFSLFTFKDGVVSSGRKGAGPAGSAPDGEEVAR